MLWRVQKDIVTSDTDRLQQLWRVEKDIVTTDTDRLHQLLMDETLPLFQRYRAMFSLRNKVNQSRIENNAF
jgi:hypothetical protein